MPLSKEEQDWLNSITGGEQAQSQSQQPASSGLPDFVPVPNISGGRIGIRYTARPKTLDEKVIEKKALTAVESGSKKIPSAQLTIINQTKNSLDRLKELQDLYGKNPDIETGPAALYFRRQGIPASVGNLALQYGMKDRDKAKRITELALKTNQTLDQYRRAVTGAQAGFPEIKFLQSAQPDPTRHVRGNLEASLQAAIEEQDQNYQMILDNLDAAGYSTDKFRQQAQSKDDPYIAEAKRRGLIK